MSNPAQSISIVKVKRTRKTIYVKWTKGEATFDLNERDNPLPDFVKAFDDLCRLIPVICHLPNAYALENCRVVGFKIGSQADAETVSLSVRKGLDDAAKEFAFDTPPRLLAHPAEPGTYTPPLSNEAAEIVREAVEQAKLYVRGERAQGQIAFETEDESDDGSGQQEPEAGATLPFEVDTPKKRKRAKRSEAEAAR